MKRFLLSLPVLLCFGSACGPEIEKPGAVVKELPPTGTGKVEGKADGATAFGSVGNALWIGAPDSPTETVLFLFSRPIRCDEILKVGWDGRIAPDAQMFEVVAIGTAPGTYDVPGTASPLRGQVAHTFLENGFERDATSGAVTLTMVSAGKSITGNFSVLFEANAMTGTFDAAWCARGVEP
jgi:hypothetical protein